MANWYLLREGTAHGPYPEEQIREWLRAGQIMPEEKLNREGDPNWLSVDMIPEFASERAAKGSVPFVPPTAAQIPPSTPYVPPTYGAGTPPKDKMVAGILALLLGYLGIHHFYLGNTSKGLLYLLVSVLSVGTLAFFIWVMAIVDGIVYLTKPDDQFQRNYQNWFCSGP